MKRSILAQDKGTGTLTVPRSPEHRPAMRVEDGTNGGAENWVFRKNRCTLRAVTRMVAGFSAPSKVKTKQKGENL